MGLDAAVFKSAARLKKEYSREFAVVDVETGEADAVGHQDFLPLRELVAASFRLGNLDGVICLREAVASVLGEKSFIAEHILYSGTHAGDCLPMDRLQSLREELNRLKQIDDSAVAKFVRQMEALIEAAQQEGNPIVFV